MVSSPIIGLCAAFYRRLDSVLMRIIDVFLSFPSILFGLSLAAMLGPGLDSLIFAVGLSVMPGIARISRGAALSIMAQDYMDSGRAIGLPDRRLLSGYLLANAYPPILTYTTLAFGDAVLLAATLGFLGLGLQPPTAELGSIAAEGRSFLFLAPHVSTAASVLIFVIVLSINRLGDARRDAEDRRRCCRFRVLASSSSTTICFRFSSRRSSRSSSAMIPAMSSVFAAAARRTSALLSLENRILGPRRT